MAFDYLGAKQAGFTDDQINQSLSKRGINFDFQGAREAGFSDDQIAQSLSKRTQSATQEKPNILGTIGRGLWDLYNAPSRMAGGQLRTATQIRKGEYQAPDLGSIPLPGGRRQELGELILPNIVGAYRGLRDKTDMFEATPEAFGVEADTPAGIALGFAGEVITPDPLDAVAGLKALTKSRKGTKALKLQVPGGEGFDDVVKVARQLDIDLPTSAKTSNQFVKQTEAILQKGLFGAGITKKITKAFDDVAGVYDNITAKFVKEQDLDALGKIAKKNLDEFADTFQTSKRALYSNVPKTVKKVQVDPTNTLKTLDEAIDQGSKGLFDDAFVGKLSKVRGRLTEAANSKTGVTYEVLDETQKQIGRMVKNFADPVSVGNKGVLRRLYASTAQDLDQALKVADPTAFEAIKNADKFYQEGIELLNDKVAKSILKKNPSEIFTYLSKPGKEQELATLKKIMGEDDFQEFTGEILQKVFNQSVDSKGVINSAKLERNLAKYGETPLRRLLTADQYAKIGDLRKQLREIDKVSEALKAGAKPAQGSQTAFLLQSILTTGGFFTNPVLASSYILGSLGATKAFQSPLMEQILTTGVSKGIDVSPALNVGRRALQGAAIAGPELLKTQFRPQQIQQSQSPIERALEKENQVRQERNILP